MGEIHGGLDKAKQGYAELENSLKDSLAKMAQAIGSVGAADS